MEKLPDCPICGASVRLTGGSHKQIAPDGPMKVSGVCEGADGHRLNRVADVPDAPWEKIDGAPWADNRAAE